MFHKHRPLVPSVADQLCCTSLEMYKFIMFMLYVYASRGHYLAINYLYLYHTRTATPSPQLKRNMICNLHL
jgi:hypothetical protein